MKLTGQKQELATGEMIQSQVLSLGGATNLASA